MNHVDPVPEALEAMLRSPTPLAGTEPHIDLVAPGNGVHACDHHEIAWPANGKGYCLAKGPDPWIIFSTSINALRYRYLVVTMTCRGVAKGCKAQFFWNGAFRPGFDERLSVQFEVIPDGLPHTYILDMHEFNGLGTINYNWWHTGTITQLRFDPVNAEGQFQIERITILDQDCTAHFRVRDLLRLPSLRLELAYRYLNGDGVEVGALQKPLPLPNSSYVRYADRLTKAEAREEYPELSKVDLVNPTLICEASALTPLADNSISFLVANHVMEHLRDPLDAIREWLRVLRNGGSLYVAVPEHTNHLDCKRQITTVDHIVADFEHRSERHKQDREHFVEWVSSAHREMPKDWQESTIRQLIDRNYAIHFHTFTRKTFTVVLEEAVKRFGGELVECRMGVEEDLTEFIGIIRK